MEKSYPHVEKVIHNLSTTCGKSYPQTVGNLWTVGEGLWKRFEENSVWETWGKPLKKIQSPFGPIG